MNLPLLKDHALFRSRDLDEAREKVAAVFCPHRLETIGARSIFDARHHHLPAPAHAKDRRAMPAGEPVFGHTRLLFFPPYMAAALQRHKAIDPDVPITPPFHDDLAPA